MTGKTVLVTGGSGFVGARLIGRLHAAGWTVRALGRSPRALARVAGLGAAGIPGDLDDAASLSRAVQGCDAVVHAAALFKLWGDARTFDQANVQGTRRLLDAARAAGSVRRFVQVGAAAVVMGDMEPMLRADERLPLQERGWAPYSASKARSEALVVSANAPGSFETMVVRPPMVWGAGMPTLDHMEQLVRRGAFRWAGDGSQAMSTAHVDNVCHAACLALERGRAGQSYFVSDGRDGTLREVISAFLATRGIAPPKRSVPLPLAWTLARALEWMWRTIGRPGEPPITRQMLRLVGQPFTLDITKAEGELGYRPVVSWEQGLAAMRAG